MYILSISSPGSLLPALVSGSASSSFATAAVAEGVIVSDIVASGSWSSNAGAEGRSCRNSDGGVVVEGGEGRWTAWREMEG